MLGDVTWMALAMSSAVRASAALSAADCPNRGLPAHLSYAWEVKGSTYCLITYAPASRAPAPTTTCSPHPSVTQLKHYQSTSHALA